jgi:predicted DNA-binding transcriptional regulator AlpA
MVQGPYLPPTGWVREQVVLAHVPFGKTKLHQEIAAGRFPAPRKFGERMIAYDSAAVHGWIEQQRQAPRDGGAQR